MQFPTLEAIANIDVTTVKIDITLEDALNLMYKENHRSVLVQDHLEFFVITASDLLKLKLKGYNFFSPLKSIKLTSLPKISKEKNILETIDFLEHSIEYICVTNKDGTLYGLLTHTDILSNMDPETLMENFKLHDLIYMNKPIFKVLKDTKTTDVLEDMVDSGYDSAVIIQDDKPIGILTTKDVMRLLKSTKDLSLPISYFMTTPIQTLNENATIKEAISFMKEQNFKRIIVTNEDGNIATIILQRELISLSYNKWATLMKEYSEELSQINKLLASKSEKYEYMASTDQLTQLYNRYKFTEVFVSEYKTMCSRKNDMCIVLFDIDHFKKINDSFGHDIGDRVLQDIAKTTLDIVRSVDVVSRWGGEEFVILLPTASIKNSLIVVQKLKDAIASKEMIKDYQVTISAGITQVTMEDTLELAIKRADNALYIAKDSGRNCIKVG